MAVISSLQSGIPLNNTGNSLKSGEVTIADTSGFFPIYNNTTGQLMTGGAFLTVQVGSGLAGSINTLVAGEALTLSVEYNAQGQFRFDLNPKGGYTISSPFYPINSEHSVGVSYDTSTGMTVLSVDGASQTAFSSYTTTSATALIPGKTLGSSLLGATSNPATFNGFLGQIALFSQAPTTNYLNAMTTDPVGANSAFFAAASSGNPVGHIESQTNSFATINYQTGAVTTSTSVLTVGSLNGIQVGDTVTDVTNPFSNPVSVVAVSNNGVTKNTTTTTTTGTTSIITLASGSGIQSGDIVTDNTTALANPVYVTAVAGTNVTLSVNTDRFTNADSLTFYRNNASVTLNQATGSALGANDTLVFTHPGAITVFANEASAAGTITGVYAPQLTTWTTQTTAASTPANSTLALASGAGIQVGDYVTDITKPLTTLSDIVTAVNGNNVTLSVNSANNISSSDVLLFNHSSQFTTSFTGGSGTSTLTVGSTAGIQVGDLLTDTTNPSTNGVYVIKVVDGTTIRTSAGYTANPLDNLIFTHRNTVPTTASAIAAGTAVNVATPAAGSIQVGDLLVDNGNGTPFISGGVVLTIGAAAGGNTPLTLSASSGSAFGAEAVTFIHPNTYQNSTTPVAATSNKTTVNATSINGISVGDVVQDITSPFSQQVTVTTITQAAGAVTGTIALSSSVSIGAADNLTFTHPSVYANLNTTTTTQGTAGVLTVASGTGLFTPTITAGQSVQLQYVTDQTRPLANPVVVTAVNATSVTLSSANNTFASGDSLNFAQAWGNATTTSTTGTTSTIVVATGTGIQVGDVVIDSTKGLTYPAYVSAVTGTNVTLSTNADTFTNADVLSFLHINTNVTNPLVAGTNTTLLNLNYVTGIQIGDIVTDTTTAFTSTSPVLVTGINGSTVTLSAASTFLTTDNLTFTHQTPFQVGSVVSGVNVPPNDVITSIQGPNSFTLTNAVSSTAMSAANLSIINPPTINNLSGVISTANTTTSTQVLKSVSGIQLGDVLIGTGIPMADHVVAINPATNTITLGIAATTTLNQAVTFVHSSLATGQISANNTQSIITVPVGSMSGFVQLGDIVNDITTPTATVNETVLAYNPQTGAITLSSPISAVVGVGDAITFTHDTMATSTATATGAVSTLTVNSPAGIQVGDLIVDVTNPNITTFNSAGVISGLSVNAINGNVVTVAAPNGTTAVPAIVAAAFSGDTLNFIHTPSVTNNGTTIVPPLTAGTTTATIGYQTTIGTQLYVNSTSGIQAGDFVFGPGIPAGDTVASTWTPTVNAGVVSPTVTLTNSTTLQLPANTNLQFVHPKNADVQIITLSSTAPSTSGAISYRAGDTISVTAYLNANTPVTKSYIVASSDITTTPAATMANVAKSFVLANPVIGAFNVINGPSNGTIELVPTSGTQQVLPAATITDVNAFGVDENTVSQYYNFYGIKTAQNTFAGANSPLFASLSDPTGANTPTALSSSYSAASTSLATLQTHGPVYMELSSLSGTNATYNIFVDPSSVTSGVLNTAGMTITVPVSSAAIANILPGANGTVTQVNNSGTGSITYQWASNIGVTDLSKPVGQLALTLASTSINSVAATATNMSVNSTNFKDPLQNVPMLEASTLNSQVYSLSGHFYQQYNPASGTTMPFGNSSAGSLFASSVTQTPIPTQDFSYTVQGYGSNNLIFVVETANLMPTTRANPTALVNLDLVGQGMSLTAAKMPFAVTINVPSNASAVNFTPGTGVTLTSGTTTNGHTLTLTGTYTAASGKGAVASSTPTLGVLQATLANEFNGGSQFTMDTVSINGVTGTGQSLYFGMGQSDTTGLYTIGNIPAGSLSVVPFSNPMAINPNKITVNDAMAVLSIAAGKGIPPGQGLTPGLPGNILPSDYMASDFNQDGQVTAADALGILNYIVSVNKANLTPSYLYIPASNDSTTLTYVPTGTTSKTPVGESPTAVYQPPILPVATDKNAANATLLTGDNTKILDIIGVLPGDVVSY